MARSFLDPRIANILIDSCAFDPKYSPEDEASRKLFDFSNQGVINLIIAHSNLKEIDHPNTPSWVKDEALTRILTIETPLTPEEIQIKRKILIILSGNGKPENMVADANHVFEANRYGSYFITTDEKILKRENEIYKLCGVNILKPSQLLEIINKMT